MRLDEIQHALDWAGWLKCLTDRKDPYVFLATGSSVTVLRHGSQDAGLGRRREITLFLWPFREHGKFKEVKESLFEVYDSLAKDKYECDVVILISGCTFYIESKRGGSMLKKGWLKQQLV